MGKNSEKIESTAEAWEDGLLGCDEKYAKLDTSLKVGDLDEALGLQQINIRLKKSVISDMKMIADIEGIGYQSLIKLLLDRFIAGEFKRYTTMMHVDKMKQLKDEQESEELEELKHA
jgi:hypothetical protein